MCFYVGFILEYSSESYFQNIIVQCWYSNKYWDISLKNFGLYLSLYVGSLPTLVAHTKSYPKEWQYSQKWLQVLKSDMTVSMHHTVIYKLQEKQKGVK